jgi:hypothetical protein
MASDHDLEPAREASIDAQKVNADNAAVEPAYTETQGQYMAFIYYYTKIHGVPPAEADMQRFFQRVAALRPQHGGDPGEARVHQAHPWCGPVDSAPSGA